ncbi:MAG: DUF2723 domain-containing protein [Polyangiales bacterium]
MPDARREKNRDPFAATALGTGFLVLYALSLCRTVFWYDSAELVTAAVTLGITHPPGYPLYTLLGHAFTWLPLAPETAVNLMSASFAALAVGLLFLVGRQLGLNRGPAAIGAATLGASRLFWSNAVVAEVYCPAVAISALVLYLLLRASNENRFSLALWAAFLAGLGLGIHLSVATLGMGFALLVWNNGRRVSRLFSAAGAALAGSLIFLYIPLRASQEPALNLCNPSSLGQFAWYISGGAYRRWFGVESSFLERGATIGGFFHDQLGWVGMGFAVAGIVWLGRQRASDCLALCLMAAGNVAFFFSYQAHDVEVFLLPTTMILCCFVGAGTQALVHGVAKAFTPDKARLATQVATVALLLFPLELAYANFESVDLSGFDETEPFIVAAVDTLPKDALILNFTTPPEWKRYAVFGMYAQLVRGERPDVKQVVAPDLRELARTFDPDAAIYVYAPVPMLAQFFEMEPAGPFLRVVSPKPMAATEAPRRLKARTRTCWQQ